MLVQSAKRHEERRHVQCLTVPLSLLAAAWIFFRPPSRALRRIPDKLLCLSRCCATISANWERQTGDSKRLWHHRIIAFIKVSQFCDHTQTHRTATARTWHCSTRVFQAAEGASLPRPHSPDLDRRVGTVCHLWGRAAHGQVPNLKQI